MISRWLSILMVLLLLTACTQPAPQTPDNPTTEEPATQPAPVGNPAHLNGKAQGYTGKASKIVAGFNSTFMTEGTINADGSFDLTLPVPTGEYLFPLKQQLESSYYFNAEVCNAIQVSDENVQAGVFEGLYVLDAHNHARGMLVQVNSAETLERGATFLMQDEFKADLIPSSGSGMFRLYVDKDVTASVECKAGGFTITAKAVLKKGWNLLKVTANGKQFSLSVSANEQGMNWHFIADPYKVKANVIEGKVEGYALGEAVVRVNAISEAGEVAIAEGIMRADGSFSVTLPEQLPKGVSWVTKYASESCPSYRPSTTTLAPSTELAYINSIQVVQNGVELGILEQGYRGDFQYSYLERIFSTQNTLLCTEGENQSSHLEMNAGWNVVSHYGYAYPELTQSNSYTVLDAQSLEFTPWMLKPAR